MVEAIGKGPKWGDPWGSPWVLTPEAVFRFEVKKDRERRRELAALKAELAAVKVELQANNETRQAPEARLAPPRKFSGQYPVERDRVCHRIVAFLGDHPDRIDHVAQNDPQAVGFEKNARDDFSCDRSTLRAARKTVGAAIRLAQSGVSGAKLEESSDEYVAERCGIKRSFVRTVRSIYAEVLLLVPPITTKKTPS